MMVAGVAVEDVDTAFGDRTLGGGGMVAKLSCRAEFIVVDVDTALGDRTLRRGGGMVAKLDGASMVTVGVMVVNTDVASGGGTMG